MGHKLANGRVLSDDEFDERLCRQHRKIKADPPQRQQMRGVWPCPGEETRQAPGESCAPMGDKAAGSYDGREPSHGEARQLSRCRPLRGMMAGFGPLGR